MLLNICKRVPVTPGTCRFNVVIRYCFKHLSSCHLAASHQDSLKIVLVELAAPTTPTRLPAAPGITSFRLPLVAAGTVAFGYRTSHGQLRTVQRILLAFALPLRAVPLTLGRGIHEGPGISFGKPNDCMSLEHEF